MNAGAALSCHGFAGAIEAADDAHAPGAALRELDASCHLRLHRAFAELALGQVLLGLLDGDVLEVLLVGLAEVDGHVIHGGEEDQLLGLQGNSQLGCGGVCVDIVGGRAVGLCGLDGGLFQARMLDEKYGLVGEVTRVDAAPLVDALNGGYIPVVATVAQGTDRETAYNVNADTAAAKLAVALEAEKLVLLTGVRGLFRTALQLTVAHLPTTVILVLLTFQAAIFCLNRWWPVVFVPVLAMLLASLFTERIFQKYSPELAAEEEKSEE